jgi:hypothetical protein
MRAVALRCPYCLSGFDRNDGIVRCSKCHAVHHALCWEANLHCSVFACDGHACGSSTLPRWVKILPPILSILLLLYPEKLVLFVPLLVPAQLCSMFVFGHFMNEIFQGVFVHWNEKKQFAVGIYLVANLIAILFGISTLMNFLIG